MNRTTIAMAIAAAFAVATEADLVRMAPNAKGKSVFALSTNADGSAELMLYGPIGDYFWDGISAREIVEQIAGITASTINVRINSDGGIVNDGLAIYNALKRHAATVNVTIDGIAASIATLIAMAGDKVVMYANTMFMVHAPMSGVWGNAVQMREHAEVLDTWARAMRESYVAKTGKPEQVDALLADGKDHYYTATEALAFGFIDSIADAPAADDDATSDAAAAAALLSYVSAIANTTGNARAALRGRIQAACRPSAFASLAEAHQRAVYAQLEESPMKQQCHLIMANAGGSPTPAATPPAAVPPQASTVPTPAPAAAPDPIAALEARNTSMRGVFAQFRDVTGVSELEAACLADPRMTIETAQAKLLAKLSAGASPLNLGNPGPSVQPGTDEADRFRAAGTNAVLARAGVLQGAERATALQGNPLANRSLIAIAEACLQRAGVNTRSFGRDEIASRVLAMQGTGDFPILLENALHKILIGAYNAQPWTWNRFCKIGTLSDYRAHGRYQLSSFSDLAVVNEHGEYADGTLGDGVKESITAQRKGRILQLTPEIIVNDDLGFLVDLTATLGRAAGRTIEKDVYTLLGLNSGAGPTLADGNPLFYASRSSGTNIDSTSAAPTVTSFDTAANILRSQKDVSGADFLDLEPAIWLGPVTKGGAARVVVNSEYDPDANSKLQRANIARNIVRDVVVSPRLTGNRWYMFADPNIAPVIEVGFLDGVREPQIKQDENFRTEGVAWRVTHKYGVAGVSYIGAVTNAGA